MLLGLLVPCVARIVVTRRARKRRATFETQLPDVLQLLITTLRSGYGLMQALDAVATEADEPARTEFLHVLTEARMGRDLVESLRSLAQRMQSVDLEWVTSAIDINRETGSNLGEVLDKVGATIRERQQIRRQVRTLTAEGRLSAVVITGMPVLLAVFMKLTNPKHFDPMLHGAGFVALAIGGGLLVIGNTMIRRVVNSITA
jgi:tight adherence protein B